MLFRKSLKFHGNRTKKTDPMNVHFKTLLNFFNVAETPCDKIPYPSFALSYVTCHSYGDRTGYYT